MHTWWQTTNIFDTWLQRKRTFARGGNGRIACVRGEQTEHVAAVPMDKH
jgi:hypothetical protein